MKILFLLNSYQEDGPGFLMYNIINGLKEKEGIACHTLALKAGGPLERRFKDKGIPVHNMKMKHLYSMVRFWQFISHLKKERFDVVITNLVRADILGRIAARLAGIPIIITAEHGIHTWRVRGALIEKIVKWVYRLTTRFTDRIIAVSDFVKNELVNHGIPEEKIVRIYNGIDINKFVPVAVEEKQEFHKYLADFEFKYLVGGVGNLVTLKGHSYFIQAIPRILETHPDSFFVFVGEGPLHNKLVEEVERLGLAQRVKFLGQLSAITARIMGAFDVLVQPSLTESFGLVVAEALACGVPVVATRVGGLPEIIEDGRTGFLVEPHSPEAIAAKVDLLLDNPELAKEMGEQGRRIVEEKFNINATQKSYLGLFLSLYQQKVNKSR